MKTQKYGSYHVTRSYLTTNTVITESFTPHKIMLARVDGKGLRVELTNNLQVQEFETGIEACQGSRVNIEAFVFQFIKAFKK